VRLFVHPIQVLREHDDSDLEFVLFSDETGIRHPIAVLLEPELRQLMDECTKAQRVVLRKRSSDSERS
jgi:hypothetical protein